MFRYTSPFLLALLIASLIANVSLFLSPYDWSYDHPSHYQSQPAKSENGNNPKIMPVTPAVNDVSHNEGQQEQKWYEVLKPTDWLLAVFTGLLVIYTRRLYRTTFKLWRSAEETAEVQLRAYVGIRPMFIHKINAGDPITVDFQIRNHGLTPAKDVTTYSVVDIYPIGLKRPFEPGADLTVNELGYDSRSVLWPRQKNLGEAKTMRPITDSDISELQSGHLAIYLIVLISYRDVSGEDRWTRCAGFADWARLAGSFAIGGSGKVPVTLVLAEQYNEYR
jgi:hypothetical protein